MLGRIMKRLVESIVWILISLVIGFALGRATANRGRSEVLKNSQQQPQQQPQAQQQLYAVGVDCYDKDGNLVHGTADKYGVKIACAEGQFARLKQPNPPAHINVP
jgi:hypothetical protein